MGRQLQSSNIDKTTRSKNDEMTFSNSHQCHWLPCLLYLYIFYKYFAITDSNCVVAAGFGECISYRSWARIWKLMKRFIIPKSGIVEKYLSLSAECNEPYSILSCSAVNIYFASTDTSYVCIISVFVARVG